MKRLRVTDKQALFIDEWKWMQHIKIIATFDCMDQENISLKQAQQQVDEWIKDYGVRYFHQLTNMAILTEEVGEMARIIARRYGEQSEKESDKNQDLGDEMADVLWVLICMANQCEIDLQAAFKKNIDKKTQRDHLRHINNPKL